MTMSLCLSVKKTYTESLPWRLGKLFLGLKKKLNRYICECVSTVQKASYPQKNPRQRFRFLKIISKKGSRLKRSTGKLPGRLIRLAMCFLLFPQRTFFSAFDDVPSENKKKMTDHLRQKLRYGLVAERRLKQCIVVDCVLFLKYLSVLSQ